MTQKMKTERNINKETTIAVAIVATISVLLVAPNALTSPVFALGHWHEGDAMNSSGEEEDNNDVGADNSESQVNQKELVSCLADTQEGSTATQDEIKDCLNTIGEEDTEDDVGSDSDAISGSDEDPENSNALNSISKGSSNIEDTEDSTQSDGNDE
jgi:hypothetical protein